VFPVRYGLPTQCICVFRTVHDPRFGTQCFKPKLSSELRLQYAAPPALCKKDFNEVLFLSVGRRDEDAERARACPSQFILSRCMQGFPDIQYSIWNLHSLPAQHHKRNSDIVNRINRYVFRKNWPSLAREF
jgi:hypothetical protein